MARVVVGMSGGVDSSVTAALLKQAGHDVVGVTLNVWPDLPNMPEIQREDACCALGAVEDARRVADKLDIPYYVLNFREVFEDKVIKDFVKTYANGMTPNPCIRCNQFIKFDALLVKARQIGAQYVATGHYARIEHGPVNRLRKAADLNKDQSYVLYVMSQDRLGAAMMPLGDFTKSSTRQLATDLGLAVANKPESQDICFVPFKRYTEFIELYAPEVLQPGPVVDQQGKILGEHRGVALHTVGQRRGLGIAAGQPLFVTSLQPETNTVVVGGPEALLKSTCHLEEVSWIDGQPPSGPLQAMAKPRYRATEVPCSVIPSPQGGLDVTFDEPLKAITPGQALVFYEGEYVLGGGTISR
ncbi:MAG TPA: tRNA 2-thiouridine(34) synthase MnmA [Chloroflexota bacterium]|nr:tRNA 2-thiouridine(34) synthase MnmA [Chloroflexota bacterium]